jgi:hypothetical protein
MAMPQPAKSEWNIGKDRYRRDTRLIAKSEGEKINSLTADQLVQAGEIAAQFGRKL